MSDLIWYVYKDSKQLGPFHADRVKEMLDEKVIPQEAYLFKVGWKDWLPLEDALEDLGYRSETSNHKSNDIVERRKEAPRATVKGRVIVHNNGQLTIGEGVNISATGIFVETKDDIFKIGEKLKLTVKIDSFKKPFNVSAKVMRQNRDDRFAVGYGLMFEKLDLGIEKEIQAELNHQNQGTEPLKKVAN